MSLCVTCGQDLPYPAEPPYLSVVMDQDDDVWQRRGRGTHGWVCVIRDVDFEDVSWEQLNRNHRPLRIIHLAEAI